MAGIVNPSCLVYDPAKQLCCFENARFESMIEDWQRFFIGTKYLRVEKLGGAYDKGRDIACTGLNHDFYLFQCKNYNRQLGFSQVIPEIAKCCYYVSKGDYPLPKEYRFVSPLGVTPKVADSFLKPAELKNRLLTGWLKRGTLKLKGQKVTLTNELKKFIEDTDFSIFNYITPKEFLESFQLTDHYSDYFNQLLKARPIPKRPPEKQSSKEMVYLTKLLCAYSERIGQPIENWQVLEKIDLELYHDLNDSREYFYSAESLAEFAREVYPPEHRWFEKVKDEFYHGIIHDVRATANDGYERLTRVLSNAAHLSVSSGELISPQIKVQDKKGICHHLANERSDIIWVRKK